jgi:DNA-binding PadR family transcriptional regulator
MRMFHRRQEEHEKWGGVHHFFHRLPLRGLLPIAVLGLIKDKPAHGGEIFQSLQEKLGIEAPRPVIYMLLRRLERTGLMVSSWDIQESGPAKRRYTITEDGLEYLNVGLESLKKVSHIINQLTGEKA